MILAPRWALRALDSAAKRRVVKDLGEIFSAQEILLIRRVCSGVVKYEQEAPPRPAPGHRLKMQYAGAVHTVVLGATLTLMPFAHAGQPLLDFSSSDVVQTFRVINDDVMGGVSTSRLRSTDGAMVFDGEVSLENGGGFASFRGPVRFPERSMVLLVTVRGDGQRYKLTLKVDDSASTPLYQAAFVAPRDWQTLRFEAANFAASYRGRAIVAPTVRFVDVQYIGLLVSDRQSGPFKVELKDITPARCAAVRGQ